MISEELITYPTAQLAKQAGFDAPCFYYYYANQVLQEPYLENGSSSDCDFRVDLTDLLDNRNCKSYENSNHKIISAPTQSLLQRWIREVCNYEVQVHYLPNIEVYCCTYTPKAVKPNTFKSVEKFKKHVSQYYSTKRHKTYELALEQALQEALTIIINRKETNNG